MLNFALKYRQMGLSVIPLEMGRKKPLILWTEYQKRRATEDEVRSWWTTWPYANIGLVTGKVSGIVVVDMDGLLGIASGKALGFTSRAKSLTGSGGEHHWFKYNGEGPKSLWKGKNEHEEVFLRSDGQYVVAPPSVHPTGRRYRWLNSGSDLRKLSELPKEFMTNLMAPISGLSKPTQSESWVSEALEEIKNGHTHNTLVRVLGKFRAHNFSEQDSVSLLLPSVLRGGMSEEQLRNKVEEIWERYEPNEVRPKPSMVTGYRESGSPSLVIHSPTNPDDLKQYERSKLDSNPEDRRELLQTGYAKLDALLKGGLKSSRLFTVAARTGVGKTNWLLGTARTLCRAGKKVLLFSTEMPYAQIWDRYIETLSDREEFKHHAFDVCDSFAPNLERVKEAVEQIKPDIFIFDHINHISEDQKELANFMQGLNLIRRTYDCAGIVTAQLNRSADWIDLKTGERIIPRMSMVKGSGTIEQASSRVLLLSETRVTPEGTEITGNLDKNDNGPKGICHFILRNNPYRMEGL